MKKLATVTTHRTEDGGGTEDQLTTFSYDGTGRPTRTLFPDGSDEVTTYEFGQSKIFTTRKGAAKTMSYDARGRETSHTWNDSITLGVTRVWDDGNRLTSLTNSNSTIAYTYDKAGQVITESNTVNGAGGAGVLTSYRYPDGAAARLIYPRGFRLRRDYAARGQLSSTGSCDANGGWITHLVTYNYLADAKVNYEDYFNGLRTSFSYDSRGLTAGTNTSKLSPAQVYSNRTYYRDTRDRIYAWAKSNTPANNPMENGRGDRYTYDNEGQLTAASYQATTPNGTPGTPERTESFVYDELGNRKGVNTIASMGAVNFTRKDNGLNQYLNWTPSVINYDDAYAPGSPGHANGVLLQDGWLAGAYNALNQMTWVWSNKIVPAGVSFSFAYDPLGRCVKRTDTASGANTYLYYDGWNLIQEGPNPATGDRIYAHGNRVDEIVASQYGGFWAYHHYDARGHCILLTNASGSILEQYDYDAFGKPYFYNASGVLQTSSGWGNRFLFTGREWLKDIAVYDFRNRHYLPELGRFMQPDPKQFAAGDYNLYRYCHNDPVNRIDPFGLFEWTFSADYPANGSGVVAGRETVERAIKIFQATERGGELQKMAPDKVVTIRPTSGSQLTGRKGNDLYLNPKDPLFRDPKTKADSKTVPANESPPETDKGRAVIIGHETGHLVVLGNEGRDPSRDNPNGRNVQKNENPIRNELGIPKRTTYGRLPIRP